MTEAASGISWADLFSLVTRLEESSFEQVALKFGDVTLQLSKNGSVPQQAMPDSAAPASPVPTAAVAPPGAAAPPPAPAAGSSEPQADVAASTPPGGVAITAPIVGIFYRASSPGAEPYVVEGEEVSAEQTIGIVEVMKMMNPVTAGLRGRILSFAVKDGEAVEFGQTIAFVEEAA